MSLDASRSAIDTTGVERSSVNEHHALAREVVLLKTVADTIADSSLEHALDHVEIRAQVFIRSRCRYLPAFALNPCRAVGQQAEASMHGEDGVSAFRC